MQEQGTGWQWCGAPQGRGQQTDGRQVPRPLAVTVAKWKVLSPGWRRPGAAPARSAFLCGYFKPWKPPLGSGPALATRSQLPSSPCCSRHVTAGPWCPCTPCPPLAVLTPRSRSALLLPLQFVGWLLGPSPRSTACPRCVLLPGCHQAPTGDGDEGVRQRCARLGGQNMLGTCWGRAGDVLGMLTHCPCPIRCEGCCSTGKSPGAGWVRAGHL